MNEVCGLVKLSRQTIYNHMKKGLLRPTYFQKTLRFHVDDFLSYCERAREATPPSQSN